jgi:hypothetical protein
MTRIDKPFIQHQVGNWLERLSELYSFVENTLKNSKGIECKSNRHMTMYEELMQKYDVDPAEVPILDIYKNKTIVASFKPVGLWVIGANGRIDILTKSGAFILVDVAGKLENSKWKVYTPKNRTEGIDFDDTFINELVRNQ